MSFALRVAVLLCGANVAWAQPAPAPDPATRAALTGQGGAPSRARTDVRTVCAAPPGLQTQVINPRTNTPPPVDCAQVLGTAPPGAAQLAPDAQIAPFQVESRAASGTWQKLGRYGSQDDARNAAQAACAAGQEAGATRVRATRITQIGRPGETTTCRATRAR